MNVSVEQQASSRRRDITFTVHGEPITTSSASRACTKFRIRTSPMSRSIFTSTSLSVRVSTGPLQFMENADHRFRSAHLDADLSEG